MLEGSLRLHGERIAVGQRDHQVIVMPSRETGDVHPRRQPCIEGQAED